MRGLESIPQGLVMLASRQSYGKVVVDLGTPAEMAEVGDAPSVFPASVQKEIAADWERRRAEKEKELREFLDAGRPRL
jgi:hypothetical protein